MTDNKTQERPSSVPAFSLALLMPRYWLIWIGLALFFCLSWMPAKILDALADALGNRMAKRNKKRYHIAKTNLSLCFPAKSTAEIEKMVFAHFRAQVRATLHYGLLWWHTRKQLEKNIIVEGLDQVETVKANGDNVIILLCHSVSLDVAIAALSMRLRSAGPYKPFRNPLIDWLFGNRRTRFGGNVFTREDGLRPLIKSVRDGRTLIYLGDEDMGAGRSIFSSFYGVEKATVPVLGRLAKTTKAKVFTCMSCYDKEQSKYVVKILPPIEVLSGKDDLADAVAMNVSIEQAINLCPVQYMWTLRLFKTRPENEPSVY